MEDVVLAHRTIGDGRSIAARAVTHVLLGLRYRKQLIHLADPHPIVITALLSRAEYHDAHRMRLGHAGSARKAATFEPRATARTLPPPPPPRHPDPPASGASGVSFTAT